MRKILFRLSIIGFFLGLTLSSVRASDDPLWHAQDPLAPRDEWGVFHQGPRVNPVDFAHRDWWRIHYYFRSRHSLLRDPAYVGSLQVHLRNRGLYCGPIDGVMNEEVSYAIARLQKNFRQSVTGTLTVPVRRVLHMP